MTAFNSEGIGKYTEFSSFTLESEAGIAYAKATNDEIVVHLNGTFIPPIYGVVPVWEKVFEVVNAVVPEEHFFSVVHGEQDMTFHQPLKAGIEIKSRAIGESISVKESGTTLVVKSESIDSSTEELILEQYFTMFFRGVDGEINVGEPRATGIDKAEYEREISQAEQSENFQCKVVTHFDDDQTFRYAHASGDFMPIHIDDDFAKSVGLPGIIIHGLCTMANVSFVAIRELCGGDPARLKRIVVRFSKPLRPGDDLETSIFKAPPSEENKESNTYYLSSKRVSDGETILANSLVETAK